MSYLRIAFLLTALAAMLNFSGCSLFPDQIDETKGWSASRLYSTGKNALKTEDYEEAIRYFELLEARYPYGRYAQQAQLEIAYAYYKYDEPESAIAAADRFIRLHPRHPNVDYVYYLKGLVNFERDRGFVERYLPQDPSQRDPGAARQAFNDFGDLVRRFPASKYSKDAAARMRYLKNNLAKHELHVARYYMQRAAFVAAANRAKHVVEKFPGTPSTSDALAIMARAYKILKLDDLSADALRVLGKNYPNHPAIAEVQAMQIN